MLTRPRKEIAGGFESSREAQTATPVSLTQRVSPTDPGHRFLDRPYGRVDRPLLKRKLLEKCVANGELVRDHRVRGFSLVHETATWTDSI